MRGLDFKPRNATAEGFWGCAVADFRLAGSGGARYLYAECCDEQCGLDRDSMMARTDDPQGEEIAIERIQNLWKSFHPGSAQPEELELTTYNLGRRLTFFASMDSSSIAVIPRTPASALSIQVRLQIVSSLAKYQSLRFLLDIVVFNPKDQDKKCFGVDYRDLIGLPDPSRVEPYPTSCGIPSRYTGRDPTVHVAVPGPERGSASGDKPPNHRRPSRRQQPIPYCVDHESWIRGLVDRFHRKIFPRIQAYVFYIFARSSNLA